MTFDDECVFIARHLKREKLISEEVYDRVLQIDEQLELLSNERNVKNWTIQAMDTDVRWIKIRELANGLCSKMGLSALCV